MDCIGHVADLVEKQRTAVGQQELAAATAPVGARVCARGGTEEFRLEQGFRNGGNTDADERTTGAGRRGVDRVGQQFLAGSGLAGQQYIAIEPRRPPGLVLDPARGRTGTDELREGVLGAPLIRELTPRRFEFRFQVRKLIDDRAQVLRPVIQDESEPADDFVALIGHGDAGYDKPALAELHQVDEIGLTVLDDTPHTALRDAFLDRTPDDRRIRIQPEQAPVAVADPHDPGRPIDGDRPLRKFDHPLEEGTARSTEQGIPGALGACCRFHRGLPSVTGLRGDRIGPFIHTPRAAPVQARCTRAPTAGDYRVSSFPDGSTQWQPNWNDARCSCATSSLSLH